MLSLSLFSQSDTISVLPWVESFDSWLPSGWQVNGDWDWSHDSTHGCAIAPFWSQSMGSSDLVSPAVQLSYNSYLVFRWSHNYSSAYSGDALEVHVSTDGTSWQPVWSKSAEQLDSNDGATSNSPGSFIQETIDLTGFTNSVVKIRFHASTGFGPDLFLDDVGISSYLVLDHDLMAISVLGPANAMAGLDARYHLTVENRGLQIEGQYQVKLFLDDTQIASMSGYNIANQEIKDYVFLVNPDSSFVGFHNLYGKIVMANDMDNTNNVTAPLNVSIAAESSGIYGYIFDGNGNPLDESIITIVETGQTAYADAHGMYYLPYVPVGMYAISTRKFMHNAESSYANVYSSEKLVVKNFVLEDGGLIAGTVQTVYGEPIRGVNVTAGNQTEKTDSNGQYTISNLNDGTYDVLFSKEGCIDSIFYAVQTVSDNNTELNCQLVKYGEIVFDIDDDAGENTNYMIILNGLIHNYAYFCQNGYTAIDSIENDIYNIVVSKQGFNDYTIDSVNVDFYDEYSYNITLNEIRITPQNPEFDSSSMMLSWEHPADESRSFVGFRVEINNGQYRSDIDSTSLFLGNIIDNSQSSYNISIQSVYSSGLSEPVYITIEQVMESDDVSVFKDELLGNFPNPFNPETSISFSLSERQNVELTIYNVIGQKVKTLCRDEFSQGKHLVKWNGNDHFGKEVAAGVYFYKIKTDKLNRTGKMILLK